MGGQINRKTCPLPWSAIDENTAAVTFNDFLYDGQAKPGGSRFVAVAVPLSEALEEVIFDWLRDSWASVFDPEADRICFVFRADSDAAALRRVPQSIGDQVGKSPGKLDRIAPDFRRGFLDVG